MLRLQVTAPGHLVVKGIIVLLQNLNGFRVGHMGEIGISHMLQALQQPLVHELIKERHLLRRILQYISDDIFQHGLRQHHIVLQIRKGHLRLNHPELRRMAGGVGILRPEGRAEGIYVFKSKCIRFHVQLAADGEIGGLPEEILGKVHFPLRRLRNVVQIQGGHLEHLARALAVAARDQRRMHIHEAPLHEEAVDGVGDQRTHPEHSLEGVRPGAQMGDGAQVFEGMALLLQGIVRPGGSLHRHFCCLHLKGLLGVRRLHDGTPYDQSRAHVHLADLPEVVQSLPVDHLQLLEKGTVIDHQEAEILGIPVAPDPSSDGHFPADVLPAVTV